MGISQLNLGICRLYILRVNDNQLEGDIPNSFVNLISLANPGTVDDDGDGLDLDYNVPDIPAGYPDPTDPLQSLLSQKDPDWQLTQGSAEVIGTEGGQLNSIDGRTKITIPAGSVLADTKFTFIPQLSPLYESG